MDLAFGFEPINGYVGIAVFLDIFSLFCVIVPIKSKTSKELLKLFKSHVFQTYGACSLFSDCESAVRSDEFINFCNDHNISMAKTAPNSPFQNSSVEVTIKLIKISLKIISKQYGINWLGSIHMTNVCMNKRILNTKFTPEILMEKHTKGFCK